MSFAEAAQPEDGDEHDDRNRNQFRAEQRQAGFRARHRGVHQAAELEVPEATRDFVKRAAGTAKDKAADFQANSEKVTSAIETAVSNSVSEATKISRNVQDAFYADVQSFFAGIDKLASAKSLTEAFQVQTDLVRAHGEVLSSRAKASTEYLGKLVSEGAKSAQDNFSKATSFAKTA
jgi:phasin